jgi:L-asparaginase
VLGSVSTSSIEFFYQPARKHTRSSDFDISSLKDLPKVGISTSYGGAPGLADPDVAGVIVATTGFTPSERNYYSALMSKGIAVGATFPSGMSDRLNITDQNEPNLVAAKHLLPTKARILMMLALTRTREFMAIQKIFDEY